MMFKGRHFDRSVILLCVRWYLAYSLSLRDLEEMMAERGISVDHTTIHRRTIHYAPLLLEQFNWRKRQLPAGGMSMKHISRSAASGTICIAPSQG
jgi:transposase-like protein